MPLTRATLLFNLEHASHEGKGPEGIHSATSLDYEHDYEHEHDMPSRKARNLGYDGHAWDLDALALP